MWLRRVTRHSAAMKTAGALPDPDGEHVADFRSPPRRPVAVREAGRCCPTRRDPEETWTEAQCQLSPGLFFVLE